VIVRHCKTKHQKNIKHEKGPLQSKLFFSRNDKHNCLWSKFQKE